MQCYTVSCNVIMSTELERLPPRLNPAFAHGAELGRTRSTTIQSGRRSGLRKPIAFASALHALLLATLLFQNRQRPAVTPIAQPVEVTFEAAPPPAPTVEATPQDAPAPEADLPSSVVSPTPPSLAALTEAPSPRVSEPVPEPPAQNAPPSAAAIPEVERVLPELSASPSAAFQNSASAARPPADAAPEPAPLVPPTPVVPPVRRQAQPRTANPPPAPQTAHARVAARKPANIEEQRPSSPTRDAQAAPPSLASPATPSTSAPTNAPAPAPGDLTGAWHSALAAWLQGHKTYPDAARRDGVEGRVVVRFAIDRDGLVKDVTLVRGSGYPVLDDAAMALLRGSRLPPPPATAPETTSITLPIRYSLAP